MNEYTLEYKLYDDKDMYYIIENGEKLASFYTRAYMALYINHEHKEYYLTSLERAQNSDKVLELIVSLRKDLGIKHDYEPLIRYSTDTDIHYTLKLAELLSLAELSSKERTKENY